MSFNSAAFLILLLVTALVYYTVPGRVQWIILLAASFYAYMSWNPALILLILAVIGISYAAGLAMPRASTPRQKKWILGITLAACLGTLFFFKYALFVTQSLFAAFRLVFPRLEAPYWNLILPVGISFYTFQTLSYVIDVYRGDIEPERHLGYYALYVCYFPQLVAGPIERPQNLLPQIKQGHRFRTKDLSAGMLLMAGGYFRKCVAADLFGDFVDRVYNHVEQANALSIAIAALLFMGQIYNDFAGYSEIAMGVSRILGISLTRNFDRPLAALNIRDYMRRWHITLNTWFRDYVYIPLGGSRRGTGRHMMNIMIVYALCGLWHGANWTYLIWGLFIGCVILLEGMVTPMLTHREKQPSAIAGHCWVLFICMIAAVIFRATSVGHIAAIFARFFSTLRFDAAFFDQAVQSMSIRGMDVLMLVLILAVLCRLRDITEPPNEAVSLQQVCTCCFLILCVVIAWIMGYGSGNTSAFVYFQF